MLELVVGFLELVIGFLELVVGFLELVVGILERVIGFCRVDIDHALGLWAQVAQGSPPSSPASPSSLGLPKRIFFGLWAGGGPGEGPGDPRAHLMSSGHFSFELVLDF